jgi:peptidoglycan-associated lipoprotein
MLRPTTHSRFAGVAGAFLLAACSTPMMEEVSTPAPPPPPPMVAPPPPPPPAPMVMTPQVVPGSRTDFVQNVGDRVLFGYDRIDITDASRQTLQKQAAWLQRFPTVVLTIEGHADERGTREYNLALGARRAQAVKDYLVSLGITGARLETISYGKERPGCSQSNDACWAQNRRGVSTIKSGAVS